LKITEVAKIFVLPFHILQQMDWAIFLAIFSQSHPATLKVNAHLHDFAVAAQGRGGGGCLILSGGEYSERLIMWHGSKSGHSGETLKAEGCRGCRDAQVIENDTFAQEGGGVGGLKVSDKVLSDKVLSDKVLSNKVLSDKVLSDKVLSNKVLSDKVLSDKVLSDKLSCATGARFWWPRCRHKMSSRQEKLM
jgi:hypothetical protein